MFKNYHKEYDSLKKEAQLWFFLIPLFFIVLIDEIITLLAPDLYGILTISYIVFLVISRGIYQNFK